jgi:hypothetical protein
VTDAQIALGRRAVACKGFRWMGGMKVVDGFRVAESVVPMMFPVDTPDLRDPATLGCLLALVREAWSAPRALVRLSANGKSFHVFDVDRVTMGGNWAAFLCGDRILQTEAEALVAALEAAP